MFNVPKEDTRLKNKDEVLIIRAEGYKDDPLAISAEYLKLHKVYHDEIAGNKFVVVTDKSGANRVYGSGNHKFKKLVNGEVKDSEGVLWKVTEEQLIAPDGRKIGRLPYHRMFWFAWFNTYENTRLVR